MVVHGFGHLVDRWLQTGPWSMVTGVFVGAGLGFLYLVSMPFGGSAGRLGSEDGRNGDEGSQGCSS
jgi:F0F1-type ATP synthase assembly protein I